VKGFNLELVTPDRLVLKEESVDEISAPGINGYFTVLPGHTPYLVILDRGILSYRKANKWFYATVLEGFVEVLPDRVMVLAENSETSEEINLDRALEAKKRAEDRLKETNSSDVDFERAQAALKRAILRINAKKATRF
jgi:F-type H+-transporting ATPase subunit epsilon